MPSAAIANSLAPFQEALMGSEWTNQALPGAPNNEGAIANPLAYNVMPLPQQQDTAHGYILKCSTVTEHVQFNGDNEPAFPTTAANRGSDKLQLPTAMYYQQRVFFGNGPDGPSNGQPGAVVHSENGSWLNITTGAPLVGAYANAVVSGSQKLIAKQMSVPHGNSILALGSYDDPATGAPTIPAANALPSGIDTSLYGEQSPDNTVPAWAADPNIPIKTGVELLAPSSYLHWNVTTKETNGRTGHAVNVPFEDANARVTDYTALYWLMSTGNGADGKPAYNYLAYSQNILLQLNLGGTTIIFPHWTSNIVTRSS